MEVRTMKKNVIALALVFTVSLAFAAANVNARGCGGSGGGYGSRGWNADPASDPVFAKFLTDTAEIRKSIAVDRAELDALMAGKEPDANRARELTASIVDNQEKLAEMARANDFAVPGSAVGSGGPGAARGYGGCSGGSNTFGGPGAAGNSPCGGCGGPGAGTGFGSGNPSCH